MQQDPKGKFLPGNQMGVGNRPHGKRIQELRNLMYASISDEQFLLMWSQLLVIAQNPGKDQLKAIGMTFERLLGPPTDSDIVQKLEQLEGMVNEFMAKRNPAENGQMKVV